MAVLEDDNGEKELKSLPSHDLEQPLKLDRHGLPLVPQPTDHPSDPLNWPYYRKAYIALLVSLFSFTSQLTSALPNPAFNVIAASLGISVTRASYITTVWILFGGVTPMFLVPLANVYGRRPLYVFGALVSAVSGVGCARATTYAGLITGRVFNGIASSIALGFGAATICDLFPQGERGLWIGIYAVSYEHPFAVDASVRCPEANLIRTGLRTDLMWTLWIPAIIQGCLWLLVLFTLPETLFSRSDFSRLENERSYLRRMFFPGKVLDRPIRVRDFFTALRMVKYAAVLLPCIYYMTANTYGSTLFAVTGSHITKAVYNFNPGQTGLFMGVPLTIGCLIGELFSGWISDLLINAYAKRHGSYRKPEVRLWLLPWTILLPIGTATYGYCIQHKKPWIDSAITMAVSGLGTQVGTTLVYTYCTDSYKPQSGEIGAILNLFKSSKLLLTYPFHSGTA
ncbi:MAG: hypothetical protein Q9157_004755 [Trypethelium eluteriae]